MWIELIGWLGGMFYAIFSIPQTVAIVQAGHARSVSLFFLILMWFGALFSLIYIWPTKDGPLMTNFIMSLTTSSIMLKYKFFERKAKA